VKNKFRDKTKKDAEIGVLEASVNLAKEPSSLFEKYNGNKIFKSVFNYYI
jgi:hypothetical protein